ncbi:MAG: Ig-like domain-containing protein [Fidelibacterota bacterium]
MIRNLNYLIFSFILLYSSVFAQSQDLSGYSFCLDPGHSQDENKGVYGYPEAHKVLRVAFNLEEFLLTMNPDTVILTRRNDYEYVSLQQRTDLANALGVSWFHSIHSDAGAAYDNSVLILYGGKPEGGARFPGESDVMSGIMSELLSAGYRIPTKGAHSDCKFYGTCRLWVLQNTQMPAELSEGGHHSHPVQNARNMNSESRRLEALSLFYSFLTYFDVPIPEMNVLTGIVTDAYSDEPLNGVVIELSDGQRYITDTYESVFSQWCEPEDNCANGFYYFEHTRSVELTLYANADNYYDTSFQVTVKDTLFNFFDFELIPWPPYVVSTYPAHGDTSFNVYDDIKIHFSRPMNPQPTMEAFSIDPDVEGFLSLSADKKVFKFNPQGPLDYNTHYKITIGAEAEDDHNRQLDGNNDGISGDPYQFSFKTAILDTSKPIIIRTYPVENDTGLYIEEIVQASFNKPIDPGSVTADKILVISGSQIFVPGELHYSKFRDLYTIYFIPLSPFTYNEEYTVTVMKGITDLKGIPMDSHFQWRFSTSKRERGRKIMDNFDDLSKWKDPLLSEYTTGINIDSTYFAVSEEEKLIYPHSAKLNYLFNDSTGFINLAWVYDGDSSTAEFLTTEMVGIGIFGDAGNNLFQFYFVDSRGEYEGSPWYVVDWVGWRFVSFDLSLESLYPWIHGDGIADGHLYFAGVNIKYSGFRKGKLFFDKLIRVSPEIPTWLIPSETPSPIPSKLVLYRNFPNPFNVKTIIRFYLPEKAAVKLDVYNILGERVKTVLYGELSSGLHVTQWDGTDNSGRILGSGIYIYSLSSGHKKKSGKMVFLK